MDEIWKPIKGYEEFYEISNFGRVKNIKVIRCIGSKGGRQYREFPMDRILKPFDNGHGYKVISLNKGGKRKNYYVHRLVGEHFLENPNGLEEINHKDYNKANNRVDNLEWCDRSYNAYYSIEQYRKPKNSQIGVTGEKFIIKRITKTGLVRYRVAMKGTSEKRFETLEEAISFRNKVLENEKYYSDYKGMFRLSNNTEPT